MELRAAAIACDDGRMQCQGSPGGIALDDPAFRQMVKQVLVGERSVLLACEMRLAIPGIAEGRAEAGSGTGLAGRIHGYHLPASSESVVA